MRYSFIKKNSKSYLFFQMLKCIATNIFRQPTMPKSFPKDEQYLLIERNDTKTKNYIPRIVWIFWEKKEMPPYIAKIIEYNIKHSPDYKFRILNGSNYKEYLPNLEFNDTLKPAHKADLLRLELLHEYGGVWIDATVILNHSLEWIQHIICERDVDIISYYRGTETNDLNYPNIEVWFLATYRHSKFIYNWLEEYRKVNELGSELYFERFKEKADYKLLSAKIPNQAYLLMNLAGQKCFRDYPEFNAFLKRAEDSALFLTDYFENNYLMNYAICRLDFDLGQLPIIKLCSGDRMFVELFLKFGFIRKKSLIGQILNS